MSNCPIRLGWSNRRGTDIVVSCDLEDGHDGQHSGDWNHRLNPTQPTTRVSWLTDDRRSFVGEWIRCPGINGLCTLPEGHHGNHAP